MGIWQTVNKELDLKEAARMISKKLLINKVRCKKCDDVIESRHTHHFVTCQCGAISVDGGTEYQHVSWGGDVSFKERRDISMEDYIDFSLSIYEGSDEVNGFD